MRVKKFLRRLMKQQKTLNVSAELHSKVKIAAANEGVKIADYAEAALEVGLKRPKEVMRLLEDRTNPESQRGSSK